jgi:Flp pilus assembly protein protease CpaA
MTLETAAQLLIKPLVYILATAPLVIDNLRRGKITNWNNAVLFVAGLGVLVLGQTLGMSAFQLPPLSPWMLVVFVPFIMFALKWVRGGAAKFLIALLPWFSRGQYIFVTVTGFFLAGVIGRVQRSQETQIAPPTVLIGLIVQAAAVRHH